MPGPLRSSALINEASRNDANVSAASIAGVVANNGLIAVCVAHCSTAVQTGDVVASYTSTPAATWQLAARFAQTIGSWRTEITVWVAHNVSAGNYSGKPTFTAGSNAGHEIWHHFDEWDDLAASASVDKTSTVANAENLATLTVPNTSALAQADQIVYSVAACRYNYVWNGNYSAPGSPPADYTVLQGTVDNGLIVAQSAYREVASTTGVGASWSYAQQTGDRGAIGVVVTFKKGGTASLRLEIDNIDEADMASTTGWTIWAWAGDPLDGPADDRWTGYAAVIVGGKLILPNAPPGASLNDVYNVSGYRPAGNQSLAWSSGVVRQAS